MKFTVSLPLPLRPATFSEDARYAVEGTRVSRTTYFKKFEDLMYRQDYVRADKFERDTKKSRIITTILEKPHDTI